MDWGQLSIDPAGLDCDSLLADWRWLVPQGLTCISLTLFGDWFLEDDRGRVQFLDTVGGRLSEIAPSRDAFLRAREEPANRDNWYMVELALSCREHGLRPGHGECLSFKLPPVLSGELEPSNVEVCDLVVHESITAQIHRGVKDLPEGTRIRSVFTEGEGT